MAQKNAGLAETLKAEVAEIKETMPAAEQGERTAIAALDDALSRVPNIPLDDVPVGKDENDNAVKHVVGQKPGWNHAASEHYEIGESLGNLDFERAAKLSSSRLTLITGPPRRLGRALGQSLAEGRGG